MTKKAVIAGGCFWGEKARGAFARPCQHICDVRKEMGDKVYGSCKE